MTEYISDREQIISLWTEAFGDRREDVELFLDTLFSEENYFSLRENGKIISQAFLVPAQLSGKDKVFDGYYFCCAATKKTERGRGLMGSLLEQIKDTARIRKKDFVALIPANRSLFDFYSRFGFERFFYCQNTVIKAQQSDNSVEFSPLFDSSELFKYQKKYLRNNPGLLVKSREIFDYLIKDARLSEYKIYSARTEKGDVGYIFFDPENLIVREALIIEEEEKVLSAFAAEMGEQSITVRQKAKSLCDPKGMIFPLNPEVKAVEKYFPFINNLLES